jgi:hypothetical protein
VATSDEVRVSARPIALLQTPGQPRTDLGRPLVVNLPRDGRLLINFTATLIAPFAIDVSLGRYNYWLLVDGQVIEPTTPEAVVGVNHGGMTVATTAMPYLTAGRHEIQVIAQANNCGTCITRNQSLTAVGPLEVGEE